MPDTKQTAREWPAPKSKGAARGGGASKNGPEEYRDEPREAHCETLCSI